MRLQPHKLLRVELLYSFFKEDQEKHKLFNLPSPALADAQRLTAARWGDGLAMEFLQGEEGTSLEGAGSGCVFNPSTTRERQQSLSSCLQGLPCALGRCWALSVVTACLTQCKITPCSTLEGILHGCRVTSWYRINGVQQILRYLLWRLIFHCRYLLPTKLYSQVWNLKQYCVQSTRIQNSLSSCCFTLNHRACTKEKWKSSNLLLTHGF